MKLLVIPDVHLKPWMFSRAAGLLDLGAADRAVCLMDIADDWGQEYNLELYAAAYDAAIRFAKDYPETLWCPGNHDLSYLWNKRESGYSWVAARLVDRKMDLLRKEVPEGGLAYLHLVDHVLFSHGGLADDFVRKYVPAKYYHDAEQTVKWINALGSDAMWRDLSPLWFRPQYDRRKLYKPRKLIQVVGHTPVTDIVRKGNLISCDVFSSDSDRNPIGTGRFTVVDSETGEIQSLA